MVARMAGEAHTDRRRYTVIAGLAGLLWPILALARVPLTGVLDQPAWTAERDTIVTFYEGTEFDAAFIVGMVLVTAAYVLLVVFLAKVASLLGGWVGILIIGGAVLDVGVVVAFLAPFAAAVFWGSHGGLVPDGYLVLHGLSFGFLWLELVTITAWLAPLGIAIVRTGLFPRWLGWAMLATALASLVAFFLSYTVWAIVGGFPYLWVLVSATVLLRRVDHYADLGAKRQ